MNDHDLAGRTAVVTGAGGGIGRALSLEAARRGMAVVLVDADPQGLAESANQARSAGGSVRAALLDVRNGSELRDLAADGPPATLLFANAGLLRSQSLLAQPPEDARLMLEVNVIGVLNTLQAFAPAMAARTDPSHIVITGSQASFTPFPDLGVYSATKHALLAIAETLAAELKAAKSITTVSLLAPGSVATGIYRGAPFPNAPLTLQPEEVARIAFAGALNGDPIISTHADLADRIERRLTGFKAALGA